MDYLEKLEMLEKRVERLEKIVENNACLKDTGDIFKSSSKTSVVRYDFSQNRCMENGEWKIENANILSDDGGISFESVSLVKSFGISSDPMLINHSITVPLDGVNLIHVRLKSDVADAEECVMNCYFITQKHGQWSQSKAVSCPYRARQMTDVYLPTKNRFWKGTLSGLRIDPVEKMRGSVEIELVELICEDGKTVYGYDFTAQESIDNSPWHLKNATLCDCKNGLMFDIYAVEKKKVSTNPFLYNDNLNIPAQNVKYLHIKLRTDIDEMDATIGDEKKIYMQVLFTTENSNFWSRDKSIRHFYEYGREVDAYIETKQLFWKGTLTGLRIDPFESYNGKTKIELIELLPNISLNLNSVSLQERIEKLEEKLEND